MSDTPRRDAANVPSLRVMPVRVSVGRRPTHIIGHVIADHNGTVDPRKVAELFAAVADHISLLVDQDPGEETPA